jgi:hypothetical protein
MCCPYLEHRAYVRQGCLFPSFMRIYWWKIILNSHALLHLYIKKHKTFKLMYQESINSLVLTLPLSVVGRWVLLLVSFILLSVYIPILRKFFGSGCKGSIFICSSLTSQSLPHLCVSYDSGHNCSDGNGIENIFIHLLLHVLVLFDL